MLDWVPKRAPFEKSGRWNSAGDELSRPGSIVPENLKNNEFGLAAILWFDTGIRQGEGKLRVTPIFIVLAATILTSAIGRPAWADHAERIRDAGVLRIATNPGMEPMEYQQNGNLLGYDIDMGNALAEHMGVRAEWVIYENLDELVTLIEDGTSRDDFDITISAMGINEKRTQRSIAVPYFKSGLTILTTNSAADVATLEDLAGKRVAAVLGSTEHDVVRRMRNVTVVDARNYGECLGLLNTGNAQVAVLDVPVALLAVKRDPVSLRVPESPFEVEWYGIYMPKDEKHLFQEIRSAIQMMRRDGTLEQLRAGWF